MSNLEEIARANVERFLADIVAEDEDTREAAYTLAMDALLDQGIAEVTASSVARRIAEDY